MKRIKLYNEDCFAVMARMKNASVDCVVTDPPYKVISGGNKTKHKAGWNVSVLHANDGKIFKHNSVKCIDYMREFYRILKPGSDCYVMTNNTTLKELLDAAKAVGFKLHNLLIWKKNTCNANRYYMADCEYTLYFYKAPAKTINNPGSKRTFEAKNPRNKRHPTEKPVSLFQHYIENSTQPNDLVIDPFMGCGTAAIACLRSNRQFVGCECDTEEGYFATASRRVSRLLKKRRDRIRIKSKSQTLSRKSHKRRVIN